MSLSSSERSHNRTHARVPASSVDHRRAISAVAAGVMLLGLVLVPHAVAADSKLAADLIQRESAIAKRLVLVAADSSLGGIADGVRGATDRRIAAGALATLRGADGEIVRNVCVTRMADRRRTPLDGSTGAAMCAGRTVRRLATSAPAYAVTMTTPYRDDVGHGLLLTSAVGWDPAGAPYLVSAELDVEALLDDAAGAHPATISAMIVDLDDAATFAAVGPPVDVPLLPDAQGDPGDGVLLGSILPVDSGSGSDGDSAAHETVVTQLWTADNGTRLGLVEVRSAPVPVMSGDTVRVVLAVFVVALLGILAGVIWNVRRSRPNATPERRIEALYREAEDGSVIDPLTGLGNLRAYEEELGLRMAAYYDEGVVFSVALLDIDDLAVVNDHEGYQSGDEMITGTAETLQQLLRPEDRAFRTGADDFAVLMLGIDPPEAVAAIERVLHVCRRPPSGVRPSSFSAGISGVPAHSTDREIVVRQAAAALAWVKGHGRSAVESYVADRDRVTDRPHDVATHAVREVVSNRMLSPVFQPIVDLRSGRVLGFEGLIRPDPKGPLPNTEHLFAAASVSGRTVELDLACVEVVLAGARAIGPDRLLTINLSPRTLEVKDFDAGWLLEGLVRNGIAPHRVILELTERDAVTDLRRLRQTFETLQQYGLRLAIDDVGSGNSGLRLLSQVRFDIVKIDLSLVQQGVQHMGSRAVLESLRDLAAGQDAKVVAEGVETAEQLQVITDLEIGAGQGYLLGRPGVSLAATFVDVRRLASGVLVPASAAAIVKDPVTPVVTEPDEPSIGGLGSRLSWGLGATAATRRR